MTQINQLMIENESYKHECIRMRDQLEQVLWQQQQQQQANSPVMFVENQAQNEDQSSYKRDPDTTENNGDKTTPTVMPMNDTSADEMLRIRQ